MSLARLTLALAGAVCLSWTVAAPAQEWTRFRGPNGTGVVAGDIPAQWSEQDIKWKVKLPAAGHSSPVLWGDKIFLTGADNDMTAQRTIFCVSAKDGQVVWAKDYPSHLHKRHKLNSFASATPTVDEERVYFVWSTPEEYTVIATDHAGNEVWKQNLGPYVSQHSCGTSPIIYQDLLVLGGDQDAAGDGKSFAIALDRKTGEQRWKLDRESRMVAYSTPCVHKTDDGRDELVFNSTHHGMTAVDPLTGQVNWEIRGILDKRSVSSPIVLANGLITASCGSGGGGNYIVTIQPGKAGEADSGKQVYKVDKQAPYVPTPVSKGDRLFLWADNGIVSSININDGTIVWQQRVGGTFYCSPIIIGDKLLGVSADGDVVILSTKDDFEQLGKNPLGDVCHSSPAFAGGRLYVRTYSHLVSVGK